jgi:hypothetical protein
MAKKRSKSRSRRKPTTYKPKPTSPKPQAQAAPAVAEKQRRPSTSSQPRPVYTGRQASHLSAMDIDNDQVMYSYVKKDLTRIGILTLLMFGTLVVLKIAGVS